MTEPTILLLEDGTCFTGEAFGHRGETLGEVVFHTGMSGYQEILTDPSYTGQLVTMTCPHIGNTGANNEDPESGQIHASGFLARDFCETPSSWRSESSLEAYLEKQQVVGMGGLDTRALTRHLRDHGAKRGAIAPASTDREALMKRILAHPKMTGLALAHQVTTPEAYHWEEGLEEVWAGQMEDRFRPTAVLEGKKVVVLDCGVKRNILRWLRAFGAQVTVVPAGTQAQDILALKPHGLMVSNGPGDPEPVTDVVATLSKLRGRLPIFGICLGHQVLGLSLGAKTFKLPFGHHGANHPVKDLRTGRVEITSQNHGFCVDPDSLKDSEVEITHMNLNDNTLEGFAHRQDPLFAVQYHPEAAPGPHDPGYLFKEFIDLIKQAK